MIEQREEATTGVVCLHCGMPTSLANSASQGHSEAPHAAERPKLSLIRCTECGKEAPYLAEEIVVFKRAARSFSYAA